MRTDVQDRPRSISKTHLTHFLHVGHHFQLRNQWNWLPQSNWHDSSMLLWVTECKCHGNCARTWTEEGLRVKQQAYFWSCIPKEVWDQTSGFQVWQLVLRMLLAGEQMPVGRQNSGLPGQQSATRAHLLQPPTLTQSSVVTFLHFPHLTISF